MHRNTSLAVLVLGAALTACATKVDVVGKFAPNSGLTVEKTPRRIAVVDFNGHGGQSSALELEGVLAQAKFEGKPFFTIVDRARTRDLMGEFVRKARGELDPATVASLGRQVGAEGILFGEVGKNFHSERSQHQRTECSGYNDKGKCRSWSTHKVQCTDRTASFSITPRLVNVETAQVVYASPKGATSSTSYCSGESQSVSDEQLLANARRSAMLDVRRDLAPYEMTIKVKLKEDTDGLEGAAKETFEGAIAFANAGRMDRACEMWRRMQADGHKTIAVLYDIAVCVETEGDLQKALQSYQVVDRMLVEPDSDVNDALKRVTAQIDEKKKIGRPNTAGS